MLEQVVSMTASSSVSRVSSENKWIVKDYNKLTYSSIQTKTGYEIDLKLLLTISLKYSDNSNKILKVHKQLMNKFKALWMKTVKFLISEVIGQKLFTVTKYRRVCGKRGR